MMDGRRVVITGVGCVSPFGVGTEALWRGFSSGREPHPPTTFDSAGFRVAGVYEAPDLGADAANRPVMLASTAAGQALRQAGLSQPGLAPAGLALASTSAGWQLPAQALGGDAARAPERLLKEWPAVVLAAEFGLGGPCAVLSSACASSTGAVSWAAERIRAGEAPVMLAGAVDVLTEVVFAGFHSMRLLSRHRTRPFADDRDGFVLAEGSAFVVMEEAEHAAVRGAPVLARFLGWGASTDATHLTSPDSAGIARSLRAAIADADRGPDQIGVFYAHGTASAVNDRAESDAVRAVLVPEAGSVATAAIKSTLGHTEGAAGLFAVIAAVEAFDRGQVPPVLGVHRQDPATSHLALAGHKTPHPPGDALVHASGFGGTNCTVVLGSAQDHSAPRVGSVQARRSPPDRPVAVFAAATATAEGTATSAVATGWHPRWSPRAAPVPAAVPRSPLPDRSCALLGSAVAALLGGLPSAERKAMLDGGMLTGTAHGGQHHHARMHAGLRARGARGVDPLDFALSTYNVPAAMTSIMFGFHGQTEAFIGVTGGVEALVSGARLIAGGRVSGVACAGWDAPENRLWAEPDAPGVPARATAIALGRANGETAVAGIRMVGMAGVCRLPHADRPASPQGLKEIADRFRTTERSLLIATGLTAGAATAATALGWTTPHTDGGAAAPLDAHIAAVNAVAAGLADDAVVVTSAAFGATIAVQYRVMTPGRNA